MIHKFRFINVFGMLAVILIMTACQKLKRPELDPNFPKDPDPPTYDPLKDFWSFEDNINDNGENELTGTAANLTYVTGISGKAIKVGAGGYLVVPTIGEIRTFPNGFVSVPSDTLSALGSFSVSFWINGLGSATGGPINDGAQGIFALSNKNAFWGNLEIFLENYTDAADPNAAWMKIHMYNSRISGGGEQWTADNSSKLNNVLNKWTHFVLVYDASTSGLTLYKDGAATAVNNKILGGGTYGDIKFANFNGISIGTFAFQTTPNLSNHGPESWAKSFNGSIDQVRLYNKALSAAEVNDLFVNKK